MSEKQKLRQLVEDWHEQALAARDLGNGREAFSWEVCAVELQEVIEEEFTEDG